MQTGSSLRRLTVLLAALCLLSGCQQDDPSDIRDYYFPVRRLTEGQVYEYTPDGTTPGPPEYVYLLGQLGDTAAYLAVNYYTPDFRPRQFSRERLFNNGMVLEDMRVYEPDSSGRLQTVPVDIQSGNIFPFQLDRQQPTPPIYLYKVRFRLPSQPNEATTTVILNRQFAADTTIGVLGDTYDAVRFDLSGVVEIRDTVDGNIEPAFSGWEIYARDLGLAAYQRVIGGDTLRYRLTDRFSMAEFVQRAEAAGFRPEPPVRQ